VAFNGLLLMFVQELKVFLSLPSNVLSSGSLLPISASQSRPAVYSPDIQLNMADKINQ
jgi:hypothetical protein